ncbi:MAG: hypothetical protein RJB22_1738, partial [Pseudomonadota bacterium]
KPEAATRGYRFDLSPEEDGAPILSVFGGKITTYRTLAEEAVDHLAARTPALAGPHWTDTAPLPGGDFGVDEVDRLIADLQAAYPFLEPAWAARLIRCYGTRATTLLGDAQSLADCGQHFGAGLTEREVRYLRTEEWAMDAEDVLWRRTKMGLHLSAAQQDDVRRFFDEHRVN